MSTQIVPFGTSNALVRPAAAQNIAVQRYQLRNLQDLLDALAAVVPPEPPMLRTSAAHFAEFVGVPPQEIDIAMLVNRKDVFRAYLKERRYQKNSIRTFVNFTSRLVRKAEEFGWQLPLVLIPECWAEMHALARIKSCRKIIMYAISLGRTPGKLTDPDLKQFCSSQHELGVGFDRANEWLSYFRRWIRKQGWVERFPSLHSLKILPKYGLPKRAWPEALRKEVDELLRWKQAEFAAGRPRKQKISPPTAIRLEGLIERLAGYAVNLEGRRPATLADLLREDLVTSFVEWRINERRADGRSLRTALSSLHAAVRHYPKFKSIDVLWFPSLLGTIPVRSESEALERKAVRVLPYTTLKLIPCQISALRPAADLRGPKALATTVHNELLMRWLVTLPWRQRNIRECRIGGDRPNLFKGPVPRSGSVARPRWISDAEAKVPGTTFWQFRFEESETKTKTRVHAFLPRVLIDGLEEYMNEHRPHLLRGVDPLTLFVMRNGLAFEADNMFSRVRTLAMRFAGDKMSPHVFRDAFAYEWLVNYPDDYLTLSKLLWHTNIQTTLRIYGAQFNESNGVCRLDEWLEQIAAKD
jgi:hypothetical protein